MADGIQISTQVLVDTAEKVRSINNALDTKLEEINKSMNDLSSTWKSDAGEEIREEMNALKMRKSKQIIHRKMPRKTCLLFIHRQE